MVELDSVDMDTTVYCTGLPNYCNGGTLPGIEWILYVDTVELTPCSDWTFNYSICCRAISQNIQNSISEGFYLESTLDNSNQSNSSPVFNQSLNLVAEINNPFCVNNNAFDADGDSLAYSLINPIGLNGNNVVFETGFNTSNPTGVGSNFTFNQNSGNLCLTPNSLGNFVIAIRVDEYRNNTLIGSTIRDFQISVVSGVAISTQDIIGSVTDSNGNPVAGVDVELFEYGISLGSLNLAATQTTNLMGEFAFVGQDVKQYLVRSQPSQGYLPTYHESTAYWQYAQVIYQMCDAQTVENIQLVDINNPLGTGVIAGYLNGSGIVKSEDPIENVNILLYDLDSDVLITNSITDQNGYYHLENIQPGSYYILVDKEGLSMISTHFIEIQEGQIIENANFYADENGISTDGNYQTQGFLNLSQTTPEMNFQIFPNPGSNFLSIHSNTNESYDVLIYNSVGSKVIEVENQKGSLLLETEKLPNGVYYVLVSSSETQKNLKWVKN
tara:strand:+ start:64891 stop:66384 length:1494 start_codon:yes stop_codon:yes gene_type:complete